MDNRNGIIDAFRGVAVLLVTAFHLFLWSSSQGGSIVGEWDFYAPFGNGWIGVGIFFVISGYCMGMSTKRAFTDGLSLNNYLIYFLKRFLRISIPYYFSIIFWIVLITQFDIAIKPTGFHDIISHVLFVHNFSHDTMFSISGVYWSLAVEMQFYIILPLLVVLFKTIKGKVALMFVCLAASIFINVVFDVRIITWSLASYLYLFVLGWVLFGLSENNLAIHISKVINKFILLIFLTLLLFKGKGFDNNIKLYELAMSTLIAIVMFANIHNSSKNALYNSAIKVLSFVGRSSFSIYLYNYIFWIFPRIDGPSFYYLMVFLFVVAFGVFMNFIIERPSETFRKNFLKKMEHR